MKIEQLEELFYLQRDMVIGITGDKIAFINPAGKRKYAQIEAGSPAGAIFGDDVLAISDELFTCSADVQGEAYTVLGAMVDDVRVYTLLPPPELTEEENLILENASGMMRRSLTVLGMAADRLTHTVDHGGDERDRASLNMVNKSYYQLTRLSDNLSDFLRLTRGENGLRLADTDIVPFLGELVQSAAHLARQRQVWLSFNSDEDTLVMAIDRLKIQKLVLNLISNSLKYVEKDATIRLTLARRGESAVLTLRDTGRGIPADNLPYIFEQYRYRHSSTDPQAGTGLGISIVQEIARLHGGSVYLMSQPESGTTVTVSLPIRSAEAGEGLLQEDTMAIDLDGDGMHSILTQLSDVLDAEVFNSRYMD